MDKYIVCRAADMIFHGGQNSPEMAKPRCPNPRNEAILAIKKLSNLSKAAMLMVSDNKYSDHKYDLEE